MVVPCLRVDWTYGIYVSAWSLPVMIDEEVEKLIRVKFFLFVDLLRSAIHTILVEKSVSYVSPPADAAPVPSLA